MQTRFRIPPKLAKRFDSVARELKCSPAEVVRESLSLGLQQLYGLTPKRGRYLPLHLKPMHPAAPHEAAHVVMNLMVEDEYDLSEVEEEQEAWDEIEREQEARIDHPERAAIEAAADTYVEDWEEAEVEVYEDERAMDNYLSRVKAPEIPSTERDDDNETAFDRDGRPVILDHVYLNPDGGGVSIIWPDSPLAPTCW
jgi:phosphoribosylaminoimidazole carboxylase (NCAIR synthetase)